MRRMPRRQSCGASTCWPGSNAGSKEPPPSMTMTCPCGISTMAASPCPTSRKVADSVGDIRLATACAASERATTAKQTSAQRRRRATRQKSAAYQATISRQVGVATRHDGAQPANQRTKPAIAAAPQPATCKHAPPSQPQPGTPARTAPARPTGTMPSSASGTTTRFDNMPIGDTCENHQAPMGTVKAMAAADATHSRASQRKKRPQPSGGDQVSSDVPSAAAKESWNEGSNSSSGAAPRTISAASASAPTAVVRRSTTAAEKYTMATTQARTVATWALVTKETATT